MYAIRSYYAILCIGLLFYFLKIKSIKKQKYRLEKLVDQRTIELQEINADLVITSYSIHYTKLYEVIVVIAMLMYIYYQRKKSRLNKKLLQSKNKELTTFTLQFVEKEKLVNELTEFIKDKLVITSYSIHYTKLYESSPN